MWEAIALAIAELECIESNPISDLILKGFATELRDSLRYELCSPSKFNINQNNTDSRQNQRKYISVLIFCCATTYTFLATAEFNSITAPLLLLFLLLLSSVFVPSLVLT